MTAPRLYAKSACALLARFHDGLLGRLDIKRGEQLPHPVEHAISARRLDESAGRVGAASRKKLVLGIEQIEQGALTDVELLRISVPGGIGGFHISLQGRKPVTRGRISVVGKAHRRFDLTIVDR